MGANRDSQRLALPHDDDEALAPGDGRIDEVPDEHRVMLRRQHDHHGGVFRTLRLVDHRRIGRNERVQLAKGVFDCVSACNYDRLPQALGFLVGIAEPAFVFVVTGCQRG